MVLSLQSLHSLVGVLRGLLCLLFCQQRKTSHNLRGSEPRSQAAPAAAELGRDAQWETVCYFFPLCSPLAPFYSQFQLGLAHLKSSIPLNRNIPLQTSDQMAWLIAECCDCTSLYVLEVLSHPFCNLILKTVLGRTSPLPPSYRREKGNKRLSLPLGTGTLGSQAPGKRSAPKLWD